MVVRGSLEQGELGVPLSLGFLLRALTSRLSPGASPAVVPEDAACAACRCTGMTTLAFMSAEARLGPRQPAELLCLKCMSRGDHELSTSRVTACPEPSSPSARQVCPAVRAVGELCHVRSAALSEKCVALLQIVCHRRLPNGVVIVLPASNSDATASDVHEGVSCRFVFPAHFRPLVTLRAAARLAE